MSRARDLADGTFSGAFSADSPTLVVDAANNRVGVGTSSPTAQLQIQNSSNPYVSCQDGTNYFNSGVITSNYGVINSSLPVSFQISDSEKMRIDSSGRITTSSQPSFEAYRTSGNVTQGSIVVFNNTRHNTGSHFNTSTGVFTAPIAGSYLFTHQCFTNAGNNLTVDMQVNSVNRLRVEADSNTSYRSLTASAVFYLSSNDTVRLYTTTGEAHYNTSGLYSLFSGYLLG